MKERILYSGILLFLINNLLSQDAAFNNTHQSLVYLNPSFAGSNGFIRNQTVYRNQWPNLSGTYVTYGSCFDGYIKPIKGGIALSVLGDNQARGTLRATSISFAYAQYISITELIKIIPSIQASYAISSLDKGRLNFGDVINHRYGIIWNDTIVPTARINYNDISAGLIAKYANWAYVGVSFSNLLEPNISHLSIYHLPVRTTIHASLNYVTSPASSAHISTLLRFQNEYFNFRFNCINAFWNRYQFGVGYNLHNTFMTYPGQVNQVNHGIVGYLGIKTKYFSITYSYDQLINNDFLRGPFWSHEISFSISLKRKKGESGGFIEQH